MENAWSEFGNVTNNAFFFVVDKIIDLQSFFIGQAKSIGSVVLLIAILTAGLNYALTGNGLKENAIKILKATLFFLIVVFAYPNIIGFISKWTFDMAKDSIYPSVRSYFEAVTERVERGNKQGFTYSVVNKVVRVDQTKLFDDLSVDRRTPQMNYTAVAPANVIKIIFFVAGECFTYADKGAGWDVGKAIVNGIKGLLCGFFIIFTGIFALLEYLVCFLEFMLVSSVGVILLPLSIWEGSKFMSEKFIGAIIGFFMKLLFCNIAIFLLIYGFISLTNVTSSQGGFNGETGQIVFILFVCLLFFYICKSAPGIAQSLLTGTPSLSATGAISAVAGAVAAAGAVHNTVGKVAGKAESALVGGAGSIAKGVAAGKAERAAGGSAILGFTNSVGKDIGSSIGKGALGMTRSLLGMKGGVAGGMSESDKNKNMTLRERFDALQQQGAQEGRAGAGRERHRRFTPSSPSGSGFSAPSGGRTPTTSSSSAPAPSGSSAPTPSSSSTPPPPPSGSGTSTTPEEWEPIEF